MPTVRTHDVETYYERRGDGPPIVFVHASVLDHAQWDPQAEALADEYAVVTYDLRGHGRTGGSSRETYSVDLFADDLDALVRALDLERPVICGASFGACVAQAYAATYPDRIGGLVLLDGWTPDLTTVGERLTMASLGVAVPAVRLVGYERVQAVLTRLQELFAPGARGDYDRVERLQAEMPPMSTDEFAKVMRALRAFAGTAVDYSAIAVPALVLFGEQSPAFLHRQAGLLAAELEDVTVRSVPGGHASNLDEPEFVTDAIRAFLARTVAPDASPE